MKPSRSSTAIGDSAASSGFLCLPAAMAWASVMVYGTQRVTIIADSVGTHMIEQGQSSQEYAIHVTLEMYSM
jgi:hypothetical protein